ncbi:PAS domain-containing protein [Roseateles sp. UC29_93]|uniref:PAS domain-containing protein n=1 Tax=Roseateles sp. UC29_93 TaxID=3350177 RepID=UPI00366BAFAA
MMRMVPREERLLFMRLLRDVVAHNSVLVTDLPFTLLDGRKRVIHIEAEPEFNEHGNACGYTGVIQDVTDRRMAEDRIPRAGQLRRADRPAQPPPADVARRARHRGRPSHGS